MRSVIDFAHLRMGCLKQDKDCILPIDISHYCFPLPQFPQLICSFTFEIKAKIPYADVRVIAFSLLPAFLYHTFFSQSLAENLCSPTKAKQCQ